MRTVLFSLSSLVLLTATLGQSVLSSGQWYKVAVTESGVYKIDRNYLSSTLGVDVSSLNPKTLKVYGSGFKGMLPQDNGISRAFDPVEYAIHAVGEDDGSMDNGDYFLFYASGPNHLSVGPESTVSYEKNIYSDTAYYFVTVGGKEGKRIAAVPDAVATGSPITTYQEIIVYEEDKVNLIQSGRRWFDEYFTSESRTYSYNVSGATGAVTLDVLLVAESDVPSSFDISLNSTTVGNVALDPIANHSYTNKAKESFSSFATSINGESIDLKFQFNPGSGGLVSIGYIDYFLLKVEREMRLYGEQTEFHLEPMPTVSTYQIQGVDAETMLWEISDISNAVMQSYSGSQGIATFTSDNSQSRNYIAFKGSNFPTPTFHGKIANQNLKALTSVTGIIVTHPAFRSEAIRLANFHTQESGLSVGVVTIDQIYNEFSAGMQDISAIRDFLKYCYDTGGRLRYATLLGDGSYDYKYRQSNRTNFVPVYESRNSFHPIFSYSSDDFYGFLEDHEGVWEEGVQKNESSVVTGFVEHTMEIGVGRLPVKSLAEAAQVVNKIIRYKTSDKTFGKWRSNIAYLTDDGDGNRHIGDAEDLHEILDEKYYMFNAKKLHLDAFEQVVNPPNEYSPAARSALLSTIEDGVLILNYLGHGSERKLTDEDVITLNLISQLKNRQKLPFFVTATCDFGKYDDPGVVSGAEQLLLNENSGAIALLTTTRPVYAHTNYPVNLAFHENVFKKINGEWPRLGDVQRLTKYESLGSGPVNRNFALLGDPMIRLNYPQYDIEFNELSAEEDTLSALETYHLSGSVKSWGSLVGSFTGQGTVTLWDIPQEKITKGNESNPYTYKEQSNLLFRGDVSVVDGKFEMQFVLPKNISYKYQPGKLTMYAWNAEEHMDAGGASRNFVLGGTAENITPDSEPPAVKLYLNDSSFSSGGTVGINSLFIASLHDESGINISNNGFNQNITLTLNDGEPLVLNEYYTAAKDDFTSGTVMYPLLNLEPGHYTATFKVCDAHNNSTSSTVEFKVSDKPVLRLYNAKIYPNPAYSLQKTTVSFEHDREGEQLLVDLSVYNMMGRKVYSRSHQIDNSPRRVDDLEWIASNDQGGDLEKGVYIYRLNVSSTQDGAYNEVIKKLIIIN